MQRALAITLAAAAGRSRARARRRRPWSSARAARARPLRQDRTPPPSLRTASPTILHAAAFGKRISLRSRLQQSQDRLPPPPARAPLHRRARALGATDCRNAPTVVGAAFGSWFTWDGWRDSLWAQALVPFEASNEIGGSRTSVIRRIARDAAPTATTIRPVRRPARGLAGEAPRRTPLGNDAARGRAEARRSSATDRPRVRTSRRHEASRSARSRRATRASTATSTRSVKVTRAARPSCSTRARSRGCACSSTPRARSACSATTVRSSPTAASTTSAPARSAAPRSTSGARSGSRASCSTCSTAPGRSAT